MIGVAILGAGGIAGAHIKAYKRFPDRCRVLSLCDLYPDKAAALAAEHGLSASVHAELSAALDDPAVGLVSICLPPSAHAEAAVRCLEAGKHVLVEKPMAGSLEECDAMIEAAERTGRLLSVVAQNRFKVPAMRVKRLLEAGALGRILHARADSYWWRGRSYYDLWWRGTWQKEGGGCTLNHAVHHIDLLRWLRGMPAEVNAVMANVSHDNSEVEDLSMAVLSHADGGLSLVTASLVHHGEEQELAFQGEKAGIAIPWKVKASRPLENGFPVDDPEAAAGVQAAYEALPAIPYEGHDGQIDDLLSAIEGRGAPLVDGREGRATLELVTAIYKSAVSRAPAVLPIPPGDEFYGKESMLSRMPRFHQKTKSVENFASNAINLGRDG